MIQIEVISNIHEWKIEKSKEIIGSQEKGK